MTGRNMKEVYEVEDKYEAFYTGGKVEWLSDGTEILTQCGANIRVVNVDSGKVVGSLSVSDSSIDEGTEDLFVTFTLSSDNETVVSSHKSGLLRTWNLQDRKVLKMWKSIHKGPVVKLALSSSGEILASGGTDSSVRLWDLTHQSCKSNLTGFQGVTSVLIFHPDQNLVLASGDNCTIVAWKVESGKPEFVLKGHFSRVTQIEIHPDKKHAVSSGRDKVLILWDLDSHTAISIIPVYEVLEDLFILPRSLTLPGKQKVSEKDICVATAGEKGVVRVWNVCSAKELYVQSNSLISRASVENGLGINHLLWNSPKTALAVVTAEHNIIFHNLETFECIKQLVGFTDDILDIALLGQDDSHMAVATNSSNVILYRISDMACFLLGGHHNIVLGLASSRKNPRLLASCSKDNSVRVWLLNEDGEGAVCVCSGERHTASVGAIAFSRASVKFIVSASEDSCLKLWNIPSSFKAGSRETLNTQLTQIAHQKDINCVCVSPNDVFIATGSQDKTAKLWSSKDLSLMSVLNGHRRGVWCVQFSPQDQILLTTSADCCVKLWSLVDFSCIKTLQGHESSVLRGEFLTDGLQLITGGGDGLLKLWAIKSGECVATFDQHEGRVWALTVSKNEEFIVTGGADSLLIRWRNTTESVRAKRIAEEEELAVQQQQLSNLIVGKQLLKALSLALKLKHPRKVLTIVQDILDEGNVLGLTDHIRKLKKERQEELLKCAINWNCNSRHCYTAQCVLSVLLEEIASGDLIVEGLRTTLEGLLPYTDRHFKRLSQLQQDLHVLSFTANCIQPNAS